jgi:hypothetical protein
MKLSTILVTGSSGLIGSEALKHFDHHGTGAPPLYHKKIPPFVIGGVAWDNWLTWYGLDSGVLVVDASTAVLAIVGGERSHYLETIRTRVKRLIHYASRRARPAEQEHPSL